MPLPSSLLTTTCDIHRPFGSVPPLAGGVACRLSPDLVRGTVNLAGARLVWTHVLDVQPGVDIRDGCTRTAGSDAIDFADGDEIRGPDGARYVVVWVETVGLGTPLEHQRVYLLRHAAP
jgi:hypothetical protein